MQHRANMGRFEKKKARLQIGGLIAALPYFFDWDYSAASNSSSEYPNI